MAKVDNKTGKFLSKQLWCDSLLFASTLLELNGIKSTLL
jgi:hypothetical protein